MKKILLLLFISSLAFGQSRTTPFSFPLWGAGAYLTSGGTTDTGVTNAGINSLSQRTNKFFDRWFYRGSDALRNDSLRGVGYVRFSNGTILDGYGSSTALGLYKTLTINQSGTFGLSVVPTGSTASAVTWSELPANGTSYVGLRAPTSLTTSTIWTLPIADGTANQVLKTDGSGNLAFVTVSGVGGSVTSVDKANGSLVVTPTTGAVTVKADSTFANIWNASQRIGFGKKQIFSNSGNTYHNTISVSDSSFYFTTNTGADGTSGTQRMKVNPDGIVTTSLSPYASNTYNFGSALLPYKVGYLDSLHLKEMKLYNGSVNYIKFVAPSLSTNTTYTYPASDGTSGYVLSTNGSGTLSWIANGSGSILPSQTGNSGKYLGTDGSSTFWGIPVVKIIYGGSTVQTSTTEMVDSTILDFKGSAGNIVAKIDSFGTGTFTGSPSLVLGRYGIGGATGGIRFKFASQPYSTYLYPSVGNYDQEIHLPKPPSGDVAMLVGTINPFTSTDNRLAYWSGGFLRDTAISSLGLITPSDTTTQRTYSTSLYAPKASPTFTGTVTTPLGAGTVRSSAGGVLSVTASDTVGLGTALFGKVNTGTDSTLSKAFSWTSLAAAESVIVYRVPCNGLTLSTIQCIRTGGTSASINATRTRAGSTVDLLTANYTTTTSMASAGTVQNTTLQNGDIIKFTVRAISGTLTELFIQLDATRSK